MAKQKEAGGRYRFTVPDADASVIAWLEAQASLSISLRFLIKEDIIRNGFTDVTCRQVGPAPRRGRPPALSREMSEAEVPAEDTAQTKPRKSSRKKTVQENASERREEPSGAKEDRLPVTLPSKTQSEASDEPAEREPEAESRATMITSMFAGGARSQAPKRSAAAAMGLLDDDDDEKENES